MATVDTKTVIPGGGGDYSSLAAWEAAEQANLVALDLIKVAFCFPGTALDTTQVTLAGWTTNASHYIQIQGAMTTQPWSPYWGGPTNIYRLSGVAGLSTGLLRSTNGGGANHVRIDRISLRVRNTACDCIRQNITSPGEAIWYISRCFIETTQLTLSDGANGIDLFGSKTYYVWNNTIFGFNRTGGLPATPPRGIWVQTAGAQAYIYANTVVGCYAGIHGETNTRAVNNLVQGLEYLSVSAFETATSFHPDTGWNAADFGFIPGTNPSLGPIILVDNVLLNVDFHLDVSDLTARRQGADLSGGPITFSDDMEGTPRGAVWDIGADQTTFTLAGVPDSIRVLDETGSEWKRWKAGGSLARLNNTGGLIQSGGSGDPGGGPGEF